MKKLFCYLMILTLIGCGSVYIPSYDIPKEKILNSNEGIIFGTISLNKNSRIKNKYSFLFAEDGSKEIYNKKNSVNIALFNFIGAKHIPDFNDGDNAIYFFTIKRKNGKYYFYGLNTTEVVGTRFGGVQNMNTLTKIIIPFEIENEKVTYLGEIKFTEKINELGERLIEQIPQVTFSNQKDRDVVKFNQQFPNLKID